MRPCSHPRATPHTRSANVAAMANDPSIRVGIIGTGWMADMIVPDFRRLDAFELVSVAGRNAERTRAFADERGIPHADTVDALLERDDLDLVYVATTHDSHFDLARRALERDLPVLLEKAFTMDATEAEQLVGLARERGVFLMEAMWMRFNPAIRRVAELLAEGAIGEPRHLSATFGFPVVDPAHRLWDAVHGGGSALDQGVYPLALADLLFGEYASLAATGSRLGPDGGPTTVDAELAILLGYADGRQATLATSLRSLLPCDASIGGTAGRIRILPAFWATEGFVLERPVHGTELEREEVILPKAGNGYVPMLEAVAESLRDGRIEHELSSHAATLRVMRAVDAVLAAV